VKKARSKRSATPTKRTLRELPEIDLARYQARPNRFAMRVQKEGIEIVHDSPSAASLAEMPEVDLSTARRRLPVTLQVGKGRPPRGEEVGPTSVRSIRLPAAVWRSLEKRATRQHMTVHSLLRTAVVNYLESPTPRRKSA